MSDNAHAGEETETLRETALSVIGDSLAGLSKGQLADVVRRPAALAYYLQKAAEFAARTSNITSTGKYELYRDKAGEFRFRLRAGDGHVILVSEGYAKRSGARNGIASVRRNAANPSCFELKQGSAGKFYFVLKAQNHQVIGAATKQETRRNAEARIIEAMSIAPKAVLEFENDGDVLELGDNTLVRPREAKDAKSALDALTTPVSDDDPYYRMLTTNEAANALAVKGRQTIHNWIKASKLIGFEKAKRGVLIPAMQIRDGAIAPGVQDVVRAIGDPERAWHFLARPIKVGGERIRPLDKLFDGEKAFVAKLASGYGEHFA